ncbi:ATP-dependent helicase [Candidatus Neomarinimicrobiota bacterium]
MSSLIEYNHDQLAAIEHPHAPLMILAGPGTGKTATLVGRIAHLIRAGDTPAEQILALTFTERAAAELKERIALAVESESTGQALSATTFHSFCYRVVLEFRPAYSERILMAEGDALFLLQEHYTELPELLSKQFRMDPILAIKSCYKFFSRLHDELILLEDLSANLQASERAYENLLAEGEAVEADLEQLNQLRDLSQIYPLYEQWKAAEGFIDYGDMITGCWEILQDPDNLKVLQQRFRTVIVDEFQDNNYALNLVVDKMVAEHGSITVVGDEDQCIYSFRGASPSNFIGFEARYGEHPQFAKILLQTNYRSTQPIIDLAAAVINENSERTPKAFHADRTGTSQPVVIISDAKAHASQLAAHIAGLLSTGTRSEELAILVRSNKQARDFVAALNALNIPSTFQDVNFFQLPAIRTALAWFALLGKTASAGLGAHRVISKVLNRVPTTDEISWVMEQLDLPYYHRKSNPEFAPDDPDLTSLVQKLNALINKAKTTSVSRMVRRCLVESRLYREHYSRGYYSDRVALVNLNQLIKLSTEFTHSHTGATLDRFYNYLTVMSATASIQPELPELVGSNDVIQVLTIHQAKGLEFKHVLMARLASGSFPTNYRQQPAVAEPPIAWRRYHSGQSTAKAYYYAEERRIFYVGITRAQEQLTLFVPEKRKSPLVKNIPPQLITESNAMATSESTERSSGANLIMQLKSELSKELASDRYDNARHIINAIEFADQLSRGLNPDYSHSPLVERLANVFGAVASEPVPQSELIELSASRMDDYERCGLMYKFKYIEKIPPREDSKPALVFGNLIHRVLEEYHGCEGEAQIHLLDILSSKWDPTEFSFSQQADEYYAEAEKVLKQYETYLAAQQYPPSTLAVEHKFRFQLGAAIITGRIDHIYASVDGGINLIDYKTSKTKLSQRDAEKQLQLALYAIYCEQARDVTLQGIQLGRPPEAVTFFFVRDPDPEVRIQYSAEALMLHRGHIEEITSSIRQRIFDATTNERTCMNCDFKDLICPKWETGS